jgi:hypothetical protein
VAQPLDRLLEFLILGLASFECPRRFLGRLQARLKGSVGRLQGPKDAAGGGGAACQGGDRGGAGKCGVEGTGPEGELGR